MCAACAPEISTGIETVSPSTYRALVAEWALEFYEDGDGGEPVVDWMRDDLTSLQQRSLTAALEMVLMQQGLGVCGTEWGKQLGGALFEFRVRHDESEIAQMFGDGGVGARAGQRILLRVFCHAYGQKVILLLGGYDKGADPNARRQSKEIKVARRRLTEFEMRRSRARKLARRGETPQSAGARPGGALDRLGGLFRRSL